MFKVIAGITMKTVKFAVIRITRNKKKHHLPHSGYTRKVENTGKSTNTWTVWW